MKVIPYFEFDGNAREAMDFYNKVFNGETTYILLFGENEEMIKGLPNFEDKIMHATMQIGDDQFYLCDMMPGSVRKLGNNVSINVSFDSLETLERSFGMLKAHGKVTMELEDMFWGARYGSVMDKFGNGWSLFYQQPQN